MGSVDTTRDLVDRAYVAGEIYFNRLKRKVMSLKEKTLSVAFMRDVYRNCIRHQARRADIIEMGDVVLDRMDRYPPGPRVSARRRAEWYMESQKTRWAIKKFGRGFDAKPGDGEAT